MPAQNPSYVFPHKNLLIVQGCPRSGTGALARVLNSHPHICISHEKRWTKHTGTSIQQTVTETAAAQTKDLGALAYIGDKMPGYYHENTAKLSPIAARIYTIHITRHPLNTIASMRHRTLASRCNPRIDWNRFLSVRDHTNEWLTAWHHAIQRSAEPNFLHLKYEDLLENPTKIRSTLAKFLELEDTFDLSPVRKNSPRDVFTSRTINHIQQIVRDVNTQWYVPLLTLEEKFADLAPRRQYQIIRLLKFLVSTRG